MPIRRDCIRRPSNPVQRGVVPPGGESYRVGDDDSWESLARQHRMGDAWALIRFNYPNLPTNKVTASLEINWYLQEYVGCKDLTHDGKNYIFSNNAIPGIIYVPKPKPRELNYWRSKLVAPFMYNEMIKNAGSNEVAQLNEECTGRKAENTFRRSMTGEPGERAARAGMAIQNYLSAALKWRDLVRGNAKWDHKPQLRNVLKLNALPDTQRAFPIEGDPDHEYFYDIWSNIHFGYVGRAAGFSGPMLQWGAARGGSAGRNDPIDVETVQIGIDLWDRYGLKLIQQQLVQEILGRKDRLLQIQETEEYRKTLGKHPDFRHVQPITDGE